MCEYCQLLWDANLSFCTLRKGAISIYRYKNCHSVEFYQVPIAAAAVAAALVFAAEFRGLKTCTQCHVNVDDFLYLLT